MTHDKVIDTLNDLIETSKDGEYGFGACAEHIRAGDLRALLLRRAAECAQASRELQSQVIALGAEPDRHGTAAGAAHRGWVSLRSVLSRYTDLAMLEECERGEDKALARYRSALKNDLPLPVRSLIERQLEGVQAHHDQIREIRDRLRAVA